MISSQTMVRVETSADGARLRWILDAPRGNLLTRAMVAALSDTCGRAAESRHLKLVTIEGAGDDFSFGASIPEHAADVIGHVLPEFHRLVRELVALPAPTAALVRGRCLGGGFEIALACDLIFAAEDATLGVPEITLGVFPPVAAVLLPLKVGAARAAEAVLTGRARPASEWREAGLVELTSSAGELDALVRRWFAKWLQPHSAAALRHAARASRLGAARAIERLLPEAERLYLDELMRTRDAAEGVAAFLARRAPRWSDE